MVLSGEVAGIHRRTDAKNLVTTARTIHLNKNNPYDFHAAKGSLVRKYTRFLTKSSAKADNVIAAVKKGRLLDVYIHPNFRTLMEHKAFFSTWCRTFMHTREKNVSFLGAVEISLLPASREGPFHVMFVRTRMNFQSHDAANITCALADLRIYSFMKVMTLDITIFSVSHPPFLPVL